MPSIPPSLPMSGVPCQVCQQGVMTRKRVYRMSGPAVVIGFQIIAAVNDARIDERRGFGWHAGTYPALTSLVNQESTVAFNNTVFRPESETANPNRGIDQTHRFAGD